MLETSLGRFAASQPLLAPGGVLAAGTEVLAVSGDTLTLSAPAAASSASATVFSKGPAPFAAGQTIGGGGCGKTAKKKKNPWKASPSARRS